MNGDSSSAGDSNTAGEIVMVFWNVSSSQEFREWQKRKRTTINLKVEA